MVCQAPSDASRDDRRMMQLCRLGGPLYRFSVHLARSRFRNLSAVDDIFAETLFEIFRKPHRFLGESETELQSWAFGIARNKAKGLLRREAREQKRLDSWRERRSRLPLCTESVPDFVHKTEHAELQRALETALRSLDPLAGAIVRLHYLEGWTVQDLAECLQLTVSATKKRLSRAVKCLRPCFFQKGWIA